MRAFPRARTCAAACLLASGCLLRQALGQPQTTTPELTTILDRAAEYVRAYGQELTSVVAEEECRQT